MRLLMIIMAKVILGLTISLDGFAEDVNGSVAALYPDLDTLSSTKVMREAIQNTGAVVMAWKEFAMAEDPDLYAGNYEFQVPIFVFTDIVPKKHPKETDKLTFTFVTDGAESAVRQAKAAAGSKDVQVIGSVHTVQLFIQKRFADELHIDILPKFLYEGLRPFEHIGNKPIQLERIKVVELPADRTHMRFRFIK